MVDDQGNILSAKGEPVSASPTRQPLFLQNCTVEAGFWFGFGFWIAGAVVFAVCTAIYWFLTGH